MGTKEFKVKLKKSGIGRPRRQKETLTGLGLTKLNNTVTLKDTPENRGMVKKVSHLIEVIEHETY
ncbi:MAG: 50S ribosomal protein L30 [Deltaproteobacteria bacterium CG_4_9_14_3_um_filter_44_9]|nr:MAG: 50S ribosomal protein L30 [Deltaproteobacteria bacterium CG06_land_8_20_14_3_00_44_19]PJB40513.1 MAG: 50S ribosomal protein L30 [Deltaproteobacteria bacterium CG_4_9_14_3_um_filter_44_9]